MRVTIDVSGDKRIVRRLRGVGDHAVNARPVFEEIADAFIEDARRDIEGRGRRRWKPLSGKTIANKLHEGRDPRILHRTGRLAGAFAGRDAPGQVLRVGRSSVEFGVGKSAIPYTPFVLSKRQVKVSGAVRARSLRLLKAWVVQPWAEGGELG